MARLDDGWYAVQVRPKSECFVADLLGEKGYERFVPLYRHRRRWSDRVKESDQPLIPNYVFCFVTSAAMGPVLTTPGAVRIVGAGRTPLPVDPQEIEALRRIDAMRLNAQPWPFLREGQVVEVTHGALSGLRGMLLSVKTARRLVVSVSLLGRSVSVELDSDAVVAVSGSMPS